MTERETTPKRGRWTYGDHLGLNPGWRLDGTGYVLDYDPLDGSGAKRGAWQLWEEGRQGGAVDHYLDTAMEWVERKVDARRVEVTEDTGDTS